MPAILTKAAGRGDGPERLVLTQSGRSDLLAKLVLNDRGDDTG